MNKVIIQSRLNARPFRPFTLRMASGRDIFINKSEGVFFVDNQTLQIEEGEYIHGIDVTHVAEISIARETPL